MRASNADAEVNSAISSPTDGWPVVVLLGPTASGKTAVASALYQQVDCSLISVDSTQVYKRMDIGSAKPSADELRDTPHELIDIREPWETYSAAEFCRDASRLIEAAKATNRVPVLVGGTMMYFRSLLGGLADMPAADADVRAQILAEAERSGWQSLHDELARVDPVAAERIHPNDPQRLQRAIEVYRLTGETITSRQRRSTSAMPEGSLLKVGLFPEDRARLHAVVGERFDAMLEDGLVGEVEALRLCSEIHRGLPSQRAVGYRQVWDVITGEYPEIQLAERGKAATRQLAKRQLTWMRSMDNLHLYDPFAVSTAHIAEQLVQLIKEKSGLH